MADTNPKSRDRVAGDVAPSGVDLDRDCEPGQGHVGELTPVLGTAASAPDASGLNQPSPGVIGTVRRNLGDEFEEMSGLTGEVRGGRRGRRGPGRPPGRGRVRNRGRGRGNGQGGAQGNGGGDGRDDTDGAAVEANGAAGGGRRDGYEWTQNERRVLFECYIESGGRGRRGYSRRVKELWDQKSEDQNLSPRTFPSLYSQLKTIDGGALTKMEREEIEQSVRRRERAQELAENGGEVEADGGEVEADGGEAEAGGGEVEAEGVEMGAGGGVMGVGDEDVDFVRDGPEVVVEVQDEVNRTETWMNKDGTERNLEGVEREVLEQLKEVAGSDCWDQVPSLKTIDRRKVKVEMALVDGVMHNLVSDGMSLTRVNRLYYTGGAVVALRLGLKLGGRRKKEPKKPWWQRRVEGNIKEWRQDLARIQEIDKGDKVKKKWRDRLEKKYGLRRRGTLEIMTELTNRIKAGSTKVKNARDKMTAFHQNTMFRNNQSQLYKGLGCKNYSEPVLPDAEGSLKLWKDLWSKEVKHNGNATWLETVRDKFGNVRQMAEVVLRRQDVEAGIKRMANWKAPGPDGVRGFWFKNLKSLHGCLTGALQECLRTGVVPEWMVKGRTVLLQKDPAEGNAASNYRPIACLPLMWKLLTGIFAEKIYEHLQENDLLPEEQKGCRKRSRGTKDQLLIDKAVLKDAREKKRDLSMGWIDYRKAYDMLPHSWIIETLNMIKIAKNVDGLLRGSMKDWKTELTSGGTTLGEIEIRRGIFQGDSLSPLLFVVAMIPLSLLLRREDDKGYALGSDGKKINHLLFMDDLKLFSASDGDMEALLAVVFGFSDDVGMEFGRGKCAGLVMKNGIRERHFGLELPDGSKIQDVEDGGYKYLGVLEGANIMVKEMKEKVRKEYLRRVNLLCESKLNAGNLIRGLNAWAVSVIRYTAGVLDWTKKECKAMDIRTRKILTRNGGFHKSSSVDRLYIRRKDGGRGLMSVRDCVMAEELGLKEYVLGSDEWMLKATAEILKFVPGEGKTVYKQRVETERKARVESKTFGHGKQFARVKDVGTEKSWKWLTNGNLDKRTEGYVCAAQEKVLATRDYMGKVWKVAGSRMCRVCGEKIENVEHLMSNCTPLTGCEYKRRHDKTGLRVYWELLRKYGIRHSERWFDEKPRRGEVRRSDDGMVEIWWDRPVKTARKVVANRPDVVVFDWRLRKAILIDFCVPFDSNVERAEGDKNTKYKALAADIYRVYKVTTKVVPVVVGGLGLVGRGLEKAMSDLGIPDVIDSLQTSALIGTAAILRKVLT